MSADVETIEKLITEFTDGKSAQLVSLLYKWRDLPNDKKDYDLCVRLVDKLIKRDEALLALDIATDGLLIFEDDVDLMHLKGLALARAKSTENANELFKNLHQRLVRSQKINTNVMTGLARTYKDLWQQSFDQQQKEGYLQKAYDHYDMAYMLTNDYFPGINSATMLRFQNRIDDSKARAQKVYDICMRQQNEAADSDYWCMATLGEAALLMERWDEAIDWYTQAVVAAGQDFGSIESMRKQASWLIHYVNAPQAERASLLESFTLPTIVVFIGHMIDAPERRPTRFPPHLASHVYDAIFNRLKSSKHVIGFASAACGSDILFHEAVQKLKGDSNVVLPYDEHEFPKHRVDFPSEGGWRTRYDKILANAKRKVVVSPHQKRSHGGIQYDYANRILTGLAAIKAQQQDTRVTAMAVWDGVPRTGINTATLIQRWQNDQRLNVDIIDLSELRRTRLATDESTSPPTEKKAVEDQQQQSTAQKEVERNSLIASLLFADVKGFSKLTDEQVPLFVQHVLGAVGQLLSESEDQPIFKNTWGDGLYMVFDDVGAAGRFALELNERLKVDWESKGLPSELAIRIALHAGPVYRCDDPVTQQVNYTGSHVSHAARIEPITPPGQVYASEEYAAITSAQCIDGVVSEYVGEVPLAKDYGTFPTYHIRRRQLDEACPI